MEEVDDEDEFPHNVAPTKKSRIIELSDGSDDEPMDLVDDNDNEEESEAPEESEEAEMGQLLSWYIQIVLIKI
jgi:hypothetical protein